MPDAVAYALFMTARWAIALFAVFAVACGSNGSEPINADPTPTRTSRPSAAPEPTADDTALEDGKHYAYIKEVDVQDRHLTVDVIQFLTGEEANQAYFEETGDSSGVPNDYFIKNENARLRTLDVSDDVNVTLAWFDTTNDAGGEDSFEDPATFEDLPEYVSERPSGTTTPYILTLDGGTVVDIKEQYVP
jgi:hypothetical protein